MTASRTGADGRSDRWQAHRDARRQELVRAVTEVVRVQGPVLRMDDIARHTGMAKPVFYRYFTDKADLEQAVGRAAAERLVRHLTASLADGGEPQVRLARAIDIYLRGIESEPDLYLFVTGAQIVGPQTEPDAADPPTVVALHVARFLGDRLRAVHLDAGSAEPWAFAVVGMVQAAGDRWFHERTMTRESLVGYLVALISPGLAPLSGPRPLDPRRSTAPAASASKTLRHRGGVGGHRPHH